MARPIHFRIKFASGGTGMVEFTVTSLESDGATTVAVAGEIDLATAPALRAALLAATGDLTVDLAAVSFMDSSGLGALVAAQKHTVGSGHRFSVRNETTLVERTMKLTGVYDFFHPNGIAPD
jgi:anti-sigma B factor antagonist